MIFQIFSIIAPVLICALIGLAWVKSGQQFETNFVSRLVITIGAPCLLFSTFMDIEISLETFVSMLSAALITTAIFGLFGFFALKWAGLSQRAFLPSQMFPNVGNMGLPLCLLAFGEEGLALALTYFTVNVVFGFTLGMSISSGTLSLKELFRNPILYAVLITIPLVFSDMEVPDWILDTTDLLAGLTIPLMLIALGVSLGSFRVSGLKRSLWLSVLRLVMGFSIGWLVAELMGFNSTEKGVLILQCSMPMAVFSYLFALRYNRQPEDVAGTVVISTLLSFIFLPPLLWFVLP